MKRTKTKICREVSKRELPIIVAGCIAGTEQGQTTTLGRGGSNYSASLFGAALAADSIDIWTRVDGVMTADPDLVSDAIPIESLTYQEAIELSHFGAKVLYPPAMQPAMSAGVPLIVKNSFNLDFPGTVISQKKSEKQPSSVSGITSVSQVALLQVEGSGVLEI